MNPKLYWLNDAPQGRLAISARPRGGDWLEDEIEGWRKQGIDVIVSLLTPAENDELDLHREASISDSKGIHFYSFPIEDRGVPPDSAHVERLAAELTSQIEQGKNVAIHCRQGIGRSSLLSAAVMISRGDNVADALRVIGRARGLEVPETIEQRKWLDRFAKLHLPTLARQTR
ncbi:MAG TPA: dual specificity protein phosphatase family protein [Terriglobales bacterium]|nr:dual specificity protein phosphatase family protein [Terriglobales bacterium]